MSLTARFVIQSSIGLLAVGLLTLLGIVGTTMWLGERAQVYFTEVIEARDARGSAVELRNAVQTAESSQRGYIATSNEIYLAPYDRAKAQAFRQLEGLNRTLVSGNSGVLLQRLTATVTEKFREMDSTITLKNGGQDEQAMAILRTNRGKSLMDEADVFLSGIIRAADERLTTGVGEQRANATMLRWVSSIGGLVIVFVVGGVIVTVHRYTREIAQARDEVRNINTSLEQRVQQRTRDLARARDRAELLLSEVNHRVANSLSLVASLVRLQGKAVHDQSAKDALDETQARIVAVSLVHRRLYSSGDVGYVSLDEYISGLLDQLQASMRDAGHGASLHYEIEPMQLDNDTSVNLGVVVTEWVTNAFKYAYAGERGDVRVKLTRRTDGYGELVVEDDGVGRRDDLPAKGTGLGSRIVAAMAATMDAQVDYLPRSAGTAARLVFPVQAAKDTAA